MAYVRQSWAKAQVTFRARFNPDLKVGVSETSIQSGALALHNLSQWLRSRITWCSVFNPGLKAGVSETFIQPGALALPNLNSN